MGGKKTGRKENWEENIIPYAAWMEELKHGGKKMGKHQNDKTTLIVTFKWLNISKVYGLSAEKLIYHS